MPYLPVSTHIWCNRVFCNYPTYMHVGRAIHVCTYLNTDSCPWCYLFSFATDVLASVYRSTQIITTSRNVTSKDGLVLEISLFHNIFGEVWQSLLFTQSRRVSIKSIKWSLCMWKMSHKLHLQDLLICHQGGNQDLCFSAETAQHDSWKGVPLHMTWQLWKQIEIYACFFFHGWFIPSGELTYPLPTGIFESKILLCPFGGIWILSLEKPRPQTQGITSLLKPMPLGDNTDPASSRWLGQGMTTQ